MTSGMVLRSPAHSSSAGGSGTQRIRFNELREAGPNLWKEGET